MPGNTEDKVTSKKLEQPKPEQVQAHLDAAEEMRRAVTPLQPGHRVHHIRQKVQPVPRDSDE